MGANTHPSNNRKKNGSRERELINKSFHRGFFSKRSGKRYGGRH
jgi:hypothetical protein